jgi:hypothetical protein
MILLGIKNTRHSRKKKKEKNSSTHKLYLTGLKGKICTNKYDLSTIEPYDPRNSKQYKSERDSDVE